MENKEPMEQPQKTNDPSSDEEWTIHSLNIHGTFLQNKVAQTVDGYRGRIKLLQCEYPVEIFTEGKYAESRIDVLGQFRLKHIHHDIFLVIECKKCNPELIDWIFYPRIKHLLHKQDHEEISILYNSFRYMETDNRYLAERNFYKKQISTINVAGDCRETREKYANVKNEIKTKTSNAAISDAAYQISLGVNGLSLKLIKPFTTKTRPKDEEKLPFQIIYYFPIIVTTANLFKIEYDLSDIDISTGEIDLSKPKLVPVDYLFYEFPISPYLQTKSEDISVKPYKIETDLSIFRHILVVNSEKLPLALNYLLSSEDYLFSRD